MKGELMWRDEKKKNSSPNICQAKIWCYLKFPLQGGGERVPKIKVAQNGVKHVLVWNFLDPIKFGGGEGGLTAKAPTNQTDSIYSD